MPAPLRYWEDYELGAVYELGSKTMTKEEIVEFAAKYDPQPFHLDEEAAKKSLFGGLAASGWHTCSAVMRLLVDNYICRETSMGSPGLDEIRWLKPVLAGDTISARIRILDKKPSRSRPEMGSISNQYEVHNQKGELVMTMKGVGLFRRRPAA
ncbi:MAG: MaoC family dehydratase [Reyranellaceae bacterium]